MAKPKKPSKKKSATANKSAPVKPASLFSQSPEDAMRRLLNAGRPNEQERPHMEAHNQPNSRKPVGQPRQRGRRV